MSDSTPPSDSPSVNNRVRSQTATADSSSAHPEADHSAEPAHLLGRRLVTGVVGQARVQHLGHLRVAGQVLDDPLGVVAVPVHPDAEGTHAAQGQPGVERAVDAAHRVLVVRQRLRQLLVVRRPARRPPRPSGRRRTWSSSAPRRPRRGPAAAAGTGWRRCCRPPAGRRARGPPAPAPRCRRYPAAGWSVSRPRQSLCCRRIAARAASTSDRWAAVQDSPQRSATLANNRNVPPYASSGITTWSPGRHTARSRVSSAARPLAKVSPVRPPSSAARHSCSASRVGLAVREYSYPSRGAPTASCAYVDVW